MAGWRALAKSAFYSTSSLLKCPSLLAVDLPDVWISSGNRFACGGPQLSPAKSMEHIAATIDGKSIANNIKAGIAGEIFKMKNATGMVPGLGIILVGKRNDSQAFVRIKIKACDEVGIVSLIKELPEDCTEDEVLNSVSSLNDDPSIHGIIVQLPLPKHLDEEKIMNFVSVEKDVDGCHPLNVGNLAMRGREPLFIPPAPRGCIELLLRSGVEIIGKQAVVIGRSKIIGLPISLLLQRHHATVSVVHSFTKNPEQITCRADIVISDVGVPNIVPGHWLNTRSSCDRYGSKFG